VLLLSFGLTVMFTPLDGFKEATVSVRVVVDGVENIRSS
jgi:hypothetical protein